MAGMLLRSRQLAKHDTSSLQVLSTAGAASSPRLLAGLCEALPHTRIVNHYTLTEAGPMFLSQPYDPARPGVVGRVGGATRVRVVADDGTVLGPGVVGELCLHPSGPEPQRSYLDDPVATAAAFRDGWLHTGDLGLIDEDGYVHLVDRKKDLIVRGGTNISCLEVEAVLAEHEAVDEVAVFGVPDELFGELVGAAAVVNRPLDTRTLRDHARTLGLGEDKLPEVLLMLDELPRTATGKVLKRDLVARAGVSR
jgi:acyl-CoA synthetase (AMP-forming)/AMP-acid ligase II